MWVYFFLCTEAVSGDGMESACRGKCGFNLSLYAKRMVSSPHLRRSGSGKLWLGRFQWPCLVMQCFVDAEPFVTAEASDIQGLAGLPQQGKRAPVFWGSHLEQTAAEQQQLSKALTPGLVGSPDKDGMCRARGDEVMDRGVDALAGVIR